MAAFDEMITRLQASPSDMSNKLTAQIAFMINLMLFASCKEHRLADGKSVRLMAFAPEQMSNVILPLPSALAACFNKSGLPGETGRLSIGS